MTFTSIGMWCLFLGSMILTAGLALTAAMFVLHRIDALVTKWKRRREE
jgi:hypothetical protein